MVTVFGLEPWLLWVLGRGEATHGLTSGSETMDDPVAACGRPAVSVQPQLWAPVSSERQGMGDDRQVPEGAGRASGLGLGPGTGTVAEGLTSWYGTT